MNLRRLRDRHRVREIQLACRFVQENRRDFLTLLEGFKRARGDASEYHGNVWIGSRRSCTTLPQYFGHALAKLRDSHRALCFGSRRTSCCAARSLFRELACRRRDPDRDIDELVFASSSGGGFQRRM
jgi:hypothetical protein